MKICANCFNDYALRAYIEENGIEGICEICGEQTKIIDTVDLSDSFDELLTSFSPSPNGVPFYEKIQNELILFNENYGKAIFQSLLDERNSLLQIDTPVDYADDIMPAKLEWESVKNKLLHKFRFLTI